MIHDFKNKIEVVDQNGGIFGYKKGLVRDIINKEYNKTPIGQVNKKRLTPRLWQDIWPCNVTSHSYQVETDMEDWFSS